MFLPAQRTAPPRGERRRVGSARGAATLVLAALLAGRAGAQVGAAAAGSDSLRAPAAASADSVRPAAPADSSRARPVAAGKDSLRAPAAAADSSLQLRETELLLLGPATTQVRLAHVFVVPGSLSAVVGGRTWEPGSDFVVSAAEGVWLPRRPLGSADGGAVLVRLTYAFRPAAVPPRRDLHAIAGAPPPSATPLVRGAPAPQVATGAVEPNVGQLSVRGSKSVRLAQGTRRDLAVDQTLRLNIEGQLTPEIAVRAALTDNNLPVVPEGNTAELRDVDNVLVELSASRWRATLGDFMATREGTVFGDYRRKLQGFTLSAAPGPVRADLLGGSPRGIYRTVEIRGQESNQGPYRLSGEDVASELFIVAGSEKVTLDGEVLGRGADRDYVIDYVRGTVTFTYRRLITAESRILVEFEEGEGPYVRTVIGGGGGAEFTVPLLGRLPGVVGVRLLRERDDPQRLRTGSLSADDLAVLAAAGDDPARAVAEGVTRPASGHGTYRSEDRNGTTVYVYDPVAGEFDVNFFFTGAGVGDYGLDSLTVAGTRVFGFRGPGAGSYRIGRPLPLPTSQAMTSVTARLGPAAQPNLSLEWNASRFDRNDASLLDDANDAGVAWIARGRTGTGALRLGGLSLGSFALSGSHENRDSRFQPFLLARDAFSYERWGLGERLLRPGFLDQRDVESGVTGAWTGGAASRSWHLTGEWGRLSHGASVHASRAAADGGWRLGGLDEASRWEQARSTDTADPLAVLHQRQLHQIGWTTALVRPEVRFEVDQWRDAARPDTGTVAAGSRLRRWGGGLAASPGRTLRWQVGVERSLADSLRAGGWQRERDGRTAQLQLAAPPVAGVRATADATLRRVRERTTADQTTRLAKVTLAGAWPKAGSDWSLIYGVDNSRAEVLDRQIVFVGDRLGDYDQTGQFVGRNQGAFNVVYAGTDSLVATTAVSGDLTWRQGFAFFGSGPWSRWSTLTHLSALGRSRTGDVGPLLRFAPGKLFEPDQTVLGTVTLRQEMNLLQMMRETDLRLSWDFDQALDRQFAAHPEDRLRRQYDATLTRALTERTSLQLRGGYGDERRQAQSTELGPNASFWTRTTSGSAEWSVRPGAGNRIALAAELIRRRDAVSLVSQREWALRPSASLRLQQRWSAILELRWAEVVSDEPLGAVRPFFFPFPGPNRDATVRLAWDPTAQLTVALSYFGREQGIRGWQHDVRLESTARF